MFQLTIKPTQNPTILKFEFPDFITYGANYEFKNIDETKNSPLAKKLFFLPFVKTVYISGNFIAIERFSIVEWEEVQDEVKKVIEDFVENGGQIIIEEETSERKKIPISIYGETTPNPSVLKFVANKLLTKTAIEFKNIDETTPSPLAKELFKFPSVKEIFIDENYVSITKYDSYDWNEISTEIRSFIKQFIENGGTVIDENLITKTEEHEKNQEEYFNNLDVTSQQIVNILEEYVKPAVQSDGGNISFENYNEKTKTVTVILKGACSGCPSSTFTLKNGIENMLRSMLKNDDIIVEALNG
ncbi:NifU family protein [Capnocytophaga sp. ARDL2]|uniref:NifU family protein n=1 Tax=Capnocytophaga sp. ARDL2 TaxID=3238809 RepID=UPI003556C52D